MSFLTTKDTILWVNPIDTEADIDWDCPCLDGVPCKEEVKAWYFCDKEKRRNRDKTKDCSGLLATMTKCSMESEIVKQSIEAEKKGF